MRLTEIDKIEIAGCFRPGDIVKAEVGAQATVSLRARRPPHLPSMMFIIHCKLFAFEIKNFRAHQLPRACTATNASTSYLPLIPFAKIHALPPQVLSLGDSRSYFLGTARNELGVVYAKHASSGVQSIFYQSLVSSAGLPC